MSPTPSDGQHPAHNKLFPTAPSIHEAITLAESKLPITSRNDLFALLMMYHNTLLKEMGADEVCIVYVPERFMNKERVL